MQATTTPLRLKTGRVTMVGFSGFGFQSKTNEYKVIKTWVRHVKRAVRWEFERVILEIHTLGTLSWRNVEVDLQISISRLECPTCVNDTLHWIIYDLGKRSLLCLLLKVRDCNHSLLLHMCLKIIIIFMAPSISAWEN